jgi:hypothetical protein
VQLGCQDVLWCYHCWSPRHPEVDKKSAQGVSFRQVGVLRGSQEGGQRDAGVAPSGWVSVGCADELFCGQEGSLGGHLLVGRILLLTLSA